MQNYTLVDVLNAAASMLDKAVPARHGTDSNNRVRIRYLIVDPTGKELLPMRDTLELQTGTANPAEVIYLDHAPTKDEVSYDQRRYFNLSENNPPLICLISAADETDGTAALLDVMMDMHSSYYEAEPAISGRFSVVCCRLFTSQDIMDRNCRAKAKKSAKLYHSALTAKAPHSYPAFCVLHAYWNTYSNVAAELTRLSAQIHNLLVLERRLLPLQNCDFSVYTDSDYPWFTFGIKETHALEIPLFQFILQELNGLLNATSDPQKMLNGKDGIVREQLLRRMGLTSIGELDGKLESWRVFIPVEISKEEFERASDLRERNIEKSSAGLLGKLFGGGRQNPAQPETVAEMIGKPLNQDSEVLISQYYASIVKANQPDEVCRMILQQAEAVSQRMSAADIKDAIDHLLELVFDAPSGSCDVWRRLLHYYQSGITEDVIIRCIQKMTGVLQRVQNQIETQISIWKDENDAVGEMPQGSFSIYMTTEESEMYEQLAEKLKNWNPKTDTTIIYPEWDARVLSSAIFEGVPSLNLLTGDVVQNMDPHSYSDANEDIPTRQPAKKLQIRMAKMTTLDAMKP